MTYVKYVTSFLCHFFAKNERIILFCTIFEWNVVVLTFSCIKELLDNDHNRAAIWPANDETITTNKKPLYATKLLQCCLISLWTKVVKFTEWRCYPDDTSTQNSRKKSFWMEWWWLIGAAAMKLRVRGGERNTTLHYYWALWGLGITNLAPSHKWVKITGYNVPLQNGTHNS